MLKVKHLYVSFTKEFFVLNDINIELKHGQRLVIVGNKESGRTAMLRTLVGLENKAKGEILYKNIPIEKIDFQNDISLGYLPVNSPFLDRKTVKQNIEYVLKLRTTDSSFLDAKVNNALVEYGLDYIKNKKVKELSYLDKLKLSIARLSVRNVDIFLIDDIFENLSKKEEDSIIKYLKELILVEDVTSVIAVNNKKTAEKFNGRKIKINFGSIE